MTTPQSPSSARPLPAPSSAAPALRPEERASYLGFVAHEVRNPLSTALWSAELLARLAPEERGGARGEKLSGMCLRALQRIRILVEDHFLAERLALSGLPLRPEPIDLGEAVTAARSRVSVAELAIDLEEPLVGWVDRTLLDRALEGLVAVAGRDRAAVEVTGRRQGTRAQLRLRGAPPAPDALALPHKGTPSDPSGRALALHMVAQVARSLGGALEVEEDAYLLAVPLAPPGALPAEPSPS